MKNSTRYLSTAVWGLSVGLSACAHGNIQRQASIHAPAPPVVQHPLYDPYMAYGSAPAVWRPSLAARAGTVVKPSDPVDQGDRPDYDHAKWGIDSLSKNAGTF